MFCLLTATIVLLEFRLKTPTSFRDLLNDEFQRRLEANRRYSLRAFARDIDVSAPFVSQIIAGKRRLSEDRAEQIADRLGWKRARAERFLKFVRAELTNLPQTRARLLKEAKQLRARPEKFESIPMNHFRVISEWYHFSILELSRIRSFNINAASVAARLGISESAASSAIDRLKSMQLLVMSEGSLKKSLTNYSTGNVPSFAIRNFHRQMLKKALAAIENQDPIDRDISGITMAIDPSKIPQAKKMIAEFRRELMTMLEASENPTALYHFSAQLFRLDINQKEMDKA